MITGVTLDYFVRIHTTIIFQDLIFGWHAIFQFVGINLSQNSKYNENE